MSDSTVLFSPAWAWRTCWSALLSWLRSICQHRMFHLSFSGGRKRESIQSWQAMVVGGPRQALQGQTAARLSQIPPFPANPLVSQKVHVKLGFPLVPAAPTGLHTPTHLLGSTAGSTWGTGTAASVPRRAACESARNKSPDLRLAPIQLLRASAHRLMGLWGDIDIGGHCLGLVARKGWRVQSAGEELSAQSHVC